MFPKFDHFLKKKMAQFFGTYAAYDGNLRLLTFELLRTSFELMRTFVINPNF